MRTLPVGLVLATAVAGCGFFPADRYPLTNGAGSSLTAPAALEAETPGVVLYLTPLPGDQIVLVAAEPVGLAAGADVEFFFSPPVRRPTGERVVGEVLRDLAGATVSHAAGVDGPDNTFGIVAVVTAHEPGRYRLTGVKLTYRLNGGPEEVREGIDVTFTVCADDPAPLSCEE